MNLFHFTPNKIELDRSMRYVQQHPSAIRKPTGFWVSIENSWFDSMSDILPHMFGHVYQVHLKESNLLTINSLEDFNLLLDTYAIDYEKGFNPLGYKGNSVIDWNAVATKYDGILFTNVFGKARFSHLWYYAWDCVGGCIWNLNGIENIDYIRKTKIRRTK